MDRLNTLKTTLKQLESDIQSIDDKLNELTSPQSDRQNKAYQEACRQVDEVIKEEIDKIKDQIGEQYASQKDSIRFQMNTLLDACDNETRVINAQISNLRLEMSSLGLFKIKEKKALKDQIEELTQKLAKNDSAKIKADYQSKLDKIDEKISVEVESNYAEGIRQSHPYPELSNFSEDFTIQSEIHSLQNERLGLMAELNSVKAELEELKAYHTGIDIDDLEDRLNGPHAFPGLKLIDELALKLGKIYKREFEDDYDIECHVEVSQIDRYADQDALPVHFLFSRNGVPILAVVVCTVNGYRRPRVMMTKRICEDNHIQYMRYFCDGGYPNEESYIIERTREALEKF